MAEFEGRWKIVPASPQMATSSKERFLFAYARKWGDEAAEYRWRLRTAATFLGVPAVACLALALALPVSQATSLMLLGIFVVLGASWLTLSIVLGHRMNAAASAALGINVGWTAISSPPSQAEAYERWCQKNGITPYRASERFDSHQ